MLTHSHPDPVGPKRTVPNGSPTRPPRENRLPTDPPNARAVSPEPPPEESLLTPEPPVTASEPLPAVRMQGNGRSSFGLEDIRAVAFRCGMCRTVVRLPRIRWASSPESCPNCGTHWMRQPSDQNSSPEDNANYVFRIVLAFRESLQALAAVEQTAMFTLLLETGESPNLPGARPTESLRKQNGRLRR
jgi:hypothetical protein